MGGQGPFYPQALQDCLGHREGAEAQSGRREAWSVRAEYRLQKQLYKYTPRNQIKFHRWGSTNER